MNTKTLLKLEENKKSILIGRIYVFVFLHILDTVIVYFIGLDYINAANQNASLTLWLPLFIFLFLSGLIRRDRISTITIIENYIFFIMYRKYMQLIPTFFLKNRNRVSLAINIENSSVYLYYRIYVNSFMPFSVFHIFIFSYNNDFYFMLQTASKRRNTLHSKMIFM